MQTLGARLSSRFTSEGGSMTTYTRPLTRAQAQSCEEAEYPRCVCRCGGRLHGKAHADFRRKEYEVYYQGKTWSDDDIAKMIP